MTAASDDMTVPAFLRLFLERERDAQAAQRTHLGSAWQETDLVVTRNDGSPTNPDSMSSAWRRHLRKHGMPPIRFHDLRHAHATLMLLEGVHPKVVSERLGHASVGITLDTYSHVALAAVSGCRGVRPFVSACGLTTAWKKRGSLSVL